MKLFKKAKRVSLLALASAMLLTGCTTDSANESNTESNTETSNSASEGDDTKEGTDSNTSEEPIVIEYACWVSDRDPYEQDEITGEYYMEEEERQIHIQVLEEIKEELNVELKFVEIPGYVQESLLQSVLAGDPLGDLVDLEMNSQGRILGQNVVQPLDEWEELLGENPAPKMFGKRVFLEDAASGVDVSLSPLVFNIDYIEAVESLKVDGETVYPTDLYLEGNWTWSVFMDYLAEIDAHYINSQAPERPEERIHAFTTDYTEAVVEAMHASGAAIYGGEEGLQIDTDTTKEAVAYIQQLMDRGLLTTNVEPGETFAPWASQAATMNAGETVFTEMETWRISSAADSASERGHSLGVIPFPRPDDMEADDPRYQPSVTAGSSTIIPRGVSEEKIPLIIQTYKLYNEKLDAAWEAQAEALGEEEGMKGLPGIDFFHEEIGADMQMIYHEWQAPINEYSIVLNNIYWDFMEIAGQSLLGVNGAAAFDVEIEARKGEITGRIDEGEKLLNTTELKDNVAPKFTKVNDQEVFTVALGQDPSTIDWGMKFTAEDHIDGPLDIANATFDVSLTDYNTVGEYTDGLVASIKDSSDNTGTSKNKVIVFDPNNTDKPVITLKEEYRTIQIDEDSSAIVWGDFVESAVDADGLNIISGIKADLSELDTTTAGEYNVVLTVTDYVGNVGEATLKLTVE